MRQFLFPIILFGTLLISTPLLIMRNVVHDDLARVKLHVTEKIAQAYSSMSEAAKNLSESEYFQAQVHEGESHGIYSYLHSQANMLEHSQIRLYNQSCQLVGSSVKGVSTETLCKLNSGLKRATFIWTTLSKGPYLYRMEPIQIEGHQYFLEVGTHFNYQWLKNTISPRTWTWLKPTFSSNYNSESIAPIHQSLYLNTQNNLISIIKYLPSATEPLEQISYLLCILGLLYWLSYQYIKNIKKTKYLEGLIHKQLYPLVQCEESQVERVILRVAEKWHHKQSETMKLKQQHQHDIRDLHAQIRKLDQNLLQFRSQRIVLEEMAHSTLALKQTQDEHISKLEDIHDALQAGVVRPAQQIFRLAQSWLEEMKQMNARKFIRSLAERNYDEQTSVLEANLQTFCGASKAIGGTSIELAIHSTELLSNWRQTNQTLNHWADGCSKKDTRSKIVRDITISSQNLAKHTISPTPSFLNQLPENINIEHLNFSYHELATIFHYMYQAVSKQFSGQAITITTSYHQKETRHLVVVNASGQSRLKHSDKHFEELGRIRDIINGEQLEVFSLPDPSGSTSVVLCWFDRIDDHKKLQQPLTTPRPEY